MYWVDTLCPVATKRNWVLAGDSTKSKTYSTFLGNSLVDKVEIQYYMGSSVLFFNRFIEIEFLFHKIHPFKVYNLNFLVYLESCANITSF